MSYDLFMFPRNIQLEKQKVVSWIKNRKNYQVEGDEALYLNENTGVHFTYRFTDFDPNELADSPDDNIPRDIKFMVEFEINYLRPSFFGLEAEIELTALVNQFDFAIQDPQMEGMAEGPYTPEGFLRGWNAGNSFAVRAILKTHKDSPPPVTCERDKLVKAWKWNYAISAREAKSGDDVFIPRMLFALRDNQFYTFHTWPDAISAIMAPTELIGIGRVRYAPKKFFFFKTTDFTILPWQEVAPLLEKYGVPEENGAIYFKPTTPPDDVVAFLKSLKAGPIDISIGQPHELMDKELVDAALADQTEPPEPRQI